jgi:hypothetical protein
VREAIENYFGLAFSVKDGSGNELVRFVNNGNVIVLKGTVTESEDAQDVIDDKAEIAPSFIVRTTDGANKAVVNPDGNMYVVGTVWQHQADLAVPTEGRALIIKDSEGNVASFIDEDGALWMRGELIVKGIPYDLRDHAGHEGDQYWPF